MSTDQRRLRRFLQFRFTTLLGLMTGIAIGFSPLKLWEVWRGSSPSIVVRMEVAEVDPRAVEQLQQADATGAGPSAAKLTLIECLDTLRSRGAMRTVSNPQIMTLDNQPATIQIGPIFYQVTPKLQRNGLIKLEYEFALPDQLAMVAAQASGQVEVRSDEQVLVCSNTQAAAAGKADRLTLVFVSAERLDPAASLLGPRPLVTAKPTTQPPAASGADLPP